MSSSPLKKKVCIGSDADDDDDVGQVLSPALNRIDIASGEGEASNKTDNPNDSDDDDINFAIKHDDFEQGDAEVIAADCILEYELDEDDDTQVTFQNVITKFDSLDKIAKGEFAKVYKGLGESIDDHDSPGLKKVIADLIQFEGNLDATPYSGFGMEALFNEKREIVGNAMEEALKATGNNHLIDSINLGSKQVDSKKEKVRLRKEKWRANLSKEEKDRERKKRID